MQEEEQHEEAKDRRARGSVVSAAVEAKGNQEPRGTKERGKEGRREG